MINSVSLLNPHNNEVIVKFELRNPAKTGFAITQIEGLGPPAANINTTEYASKNGAVFNSSRVGSRNIVLYFTFVEGVMSIEELRHASYDYFPVQGLVRIKFECDKRTGYIDGYVESNEPEIFSSMESTQVSIICPDPLFHGSLDLQHVRFTYLEPQFYFPFANDSLHDKNLVMGEIRKTKTKELTYHGDTGEGATIKLSFAGPVKNITVKNESTNQAMMIDTEKIKSSTTKTSFGDFADGDRIEITTMSGNKTITLIYTRDKRYKKNILNCLSGDSQWITLQNGNNVLTVDAEEHAENINDVTVETTATYMGL